MNRWLLYILGIILFFAACKSDEEYSDTNTDTNVFEKGKRTIMVYMSGENDLTDFVVDDLAEMATASKQMSQDCRLIAYVDKAGSDSLPKIIRFEDGQQIQDELYVRKSDQISTDPAVLEEFIRWATTRYPAESYGLILWGHANGWLIESDSIATTRSNIRRAYGRDTGNNSASQTLGKWLNTPSMATALSESLPQKLKFIFADCCNFQCIENAYELRNVAEYIIGSPAEIPGNGAPYHQTIIDLCSLSDTFYVAAVDHYHDMYDRYNRHVPLSVIKTSEIEQLALATTELLAGMKPMSQFNYDGLIYYTGAEFQRVCYDMKDMLLFNGGTDSIREARWKEAFDCAVVYKRMSTLWMTNGHVFFDFDVTDERYGGVSMFFTKDAYNVSPLKYNEDIKKMGWYWAVGPEWYEK